MGGRFGKYGDAKRKAQLRKNWPDRRRYAYGIVHVLDERPGFPGLIVVRDRLVGWNIK
ncbi:MAG: hypothetical protein KAU38_11160 [Desulfobacterales bacterium]|nr:hypothetical protein [Desulfobacterales bacterium]